MNLRPTTFHLLLATVSIAALPVDLLAAKPVPLIFDTDIGNDVDDVLALGMIHALQTRGECKLLAVTITKDHELAASFTDAVNTFYGREDVPIGVCHSGVTPAQGKFNGLGSQKDNGKLRYPHDLLSGKNAPDAVTVLRRALANAEDGSVAIAQVGFSTNLANLLDSKADDISPLSGVALVRKKAKLLSIMAGAFTKIPVF
ncbi:MAG: nucleoside hydrolase [Planctomycetota bacterium]|jgi:inosine-uridine nucleoside N-ribohydrolase